MIIIASPNEQIPEQMARMASAVLVLDNNGTLRDYSPLPSHATPKRETAIMPTPLDRAVKAVQEEVDDFRAFFQRKPLPGQVPNTPVRSAPPVQSFASDVPALPSTTNGKSSIHDVEAAILNFTSHTLGAPNDRSTGKDIRVHPRKS